MAPYHNIRPENILKRAEELIAVGQPDAAHEILYELITSKRTRSLSPASLEPVALLFIELSVSLRKGKIAKDGLHQYKKNVQLGTSGLQSVETVVRRFIELAEKKLNEAQAQATSAIDADVDLEAVDTPETILLSAVSNDDSADRTERELVNPWLRFLWEAYRAVIDILRNNSRLEVTYAAIVNQAFDFCLNFNRKAEFRRLCELLRAHIQSASIQQKSTNENKVNAVDLSDSKTLQRYLDLRFTQLNNSVKLELWQESFRSVEDVHSLLSLTKGQPKPTMMVNYYENLARIFRVSENSLFHAAAWSKFFNLYQQSPVATDKELSHYASIFVLSTLSIPYVSSNTDAVDESRNRNSKLSTLLNMNVTPTRENLISLIISKNVLSFVDSSIVKLYQALEGSFHPLTIRSQLAGSFKTIESNEGLRAYVKPLTNVILVRLFQQISQVYETVKLDFLIKLSTFEGDFKLSPFQIENLLVNSAKSGYLSLSIDHDAHVVTFKSNPFDDSFEFKKLESSLQRTPTELVCTQLSKLASTLLSSVKFVDPKYESKKIAARDNAIRLALAGIAEEQKQIDTRADILAERKRKSEAERIAKEEEVAKQRSERMIAEKKAEEERREQEVLRRQKEKIQREKDAIREKEKKQLAEEINAKGIIKIDIDSLEDVDADKLRIMQVEQLAKDKKEVEDRLKSIARKMDHTERAFRRYELPLLEKDAELQKQKDIEDYEQLKERLVSNAKKEHDEALVLRDRFQKILPDYISFRKEIESKNATEFSKISKLAKDNLAKEKQARKELVIAQRKAEIIARREAEIQAEKDAERQAAEAERKSNELAKLKEEMVAQKIKDAERLKIQLQREAEVEAKSKSPITFSDRQRANRLASGSSSPVPAPQRQIPTPTPSPVSTPVSAPAPESSSDKPISYTEKMRLKRLGK